MTRQTAKALEDTDPVLLGMEREIHRLRAQNAALLEALRRISIRAENEGHYWIADEAKTAIAQVERGETA